MKNIILDGLEMVETNLSSYEEPFRLKHEIRDKKLTIKIGSSDHYDGNIVGIESGGTIYGQVKDTFFYYDSLANEKWGLILTGKGKVFFHNYVYTEIEVGSGVELYLFSFNVDTKLKIEAGGKVYSLDLSPPNLSLEQHLLKLSLKQGLEKDRLFWVSGDKIYNEEEWLIKEIVE